MTDPNRHETVKAGIAATFDLSIESPLEIVRTPIHNCNPQLLTILGTGLLRLRRTRWDTRAPATHHCRLSALWIIPERRHGADP